MFSLSLSCLDFNPFAFSEQLQVISHNPRFGAYFGDQNLRARLAYRYTKVSSFVSQLLGIGSLRRAFQRFGGGLPDRPFGSPAPSIGVRSVRSACAVRCEICRFPLPDRCLAHFVLPLSGGFSQLQYVALCSAFEWRVLYDSVASSCCRLACDCIPFFSPRTNGSARSRSGATNHTER